MGIWIPNMEKPDTCDMCPIDGCEYINGKFTCPLIEIDDIKFKACLEILDKFMDALDHSLLYGKVRDQMEKFKVGEYIIYVNGDKYELGRIKSITNDGAFVAYHEGETGAKTPFDLMHKLVNAYCIKETTLGGEFFNK